VNPPELLEPANREEARLLDQLDESRLPKHIAIIMDGNGRWAERRHFPRVAGHRAGVDSARAVIETCSRLGLPALTLYAFLGAPISFPKVFAPTSSGAWSSPPRTPACALPLH
jgi:undecaprenyl pyrophosphate synthase